MNEECIATESQKRKYILDEGRAAGAQYYKWSSLGEEAQDEVTLRFVCSWNTREEDVEALIAALRG